mmetsp:Transcript_31080/g.41097  ORF Transcript_31080/g.41097 Transcript_31080/m.41097 type:complete len:236 (+) Transcript_31080:30-737(+)|eukprot:CAMPEP_0117751742 /NCGR_PEP_ID=MMETSP0947-20121206/11163_1 /TAXON_ID=44440 /ORGANISM="Chattonella subsalsa, Strain CCMP2191" /LENGTH=235 /DNA_ID=CAMNT_0005570195 /DNA_START=30 /DNA_END=737 /DNA_ORIENTATION=+
MQRNDQHHVRDELDLKECEMLNRINATQNLIQELKEKLVSDQSYYEARAEKAEARRFQAHKEAESLALKSNQEVARAVGYLRGVVGGWVLGMGIGWTAGGLLSEAMVSPTRAVYSTSPLLGLLLVVPFVTFGIMGGILYAKLQEKANSWKSKTVSPMKQERPSINASDFFQSQNRSRSPARSSSSNLIVDLGHKAYSLTSWTVQGSFHLTCSAMSTTWKVVTSPFAESKKHNKEE